MIDIPVYSIHGIPVAVKTPAPLTSREGITVDNYINHLCVWNPALQDWTNINNIVAVGTVNSGYTLEYFTRNYGNEPMGYDVPIDLKFIQWRTRYRNLCRALHQYETAIVQLHKKLAECKNDNVTYQETSDASAFAITTRNQYDLHFSIANTTKANTIMPASIRQTRILDRLKRMTATHRACRDDFIHLEIIDSIDLQLIDAGPLMYIDMADINLDRLPKTSPITIDIREDEQETRYHFILDNRNIGVIDALSKMASKSFCLNQNVDELVLLFRDIKPYTDDLPVVSNS